MKALCRELSQYSEDTNNFMKIGNEIVIWDENTSLSIRRQSDEHISFAIRKGNDREFEINMSKNDFCIHDKIKNNLNTKLRDIIIKLVLSHKENFDLLQEFFKDTTTNTKQILEDCSISDLLINHSYVGLLLYAINETWYQEKIKEGN